MTKVIEAESSSDNEDGNSDTIVGCVIPVRVRHSSGVETITENGSFRWEL